MYTPKAFEQLDVSAMHKLMYEHPFATLVVLTGDGIEANHLPLLLRKSSSEYGAVVGHIARANPLWEKIKPDTEVLVIFHGPDAYISPNWYPTKREHGKVVPTWNYAVVHARGKLHIVDDAQWLNELLRELTEIHEATFEQPWSVNDAPADYVEKMTKAIVGIEINITNLQGKWKLSQNQPDANQQGVIAGLSGTSTIQNHLADLMILNAKGVV
jgi:transcriptional regulator